MTANNSSTRKPVNKAKSSDKWSTSVPVETNPSYWLGDPVMTQGEHKGAPKKLSVGELFCGLGGLSQGFIQAGFDLALGADIHEPSIESFVANHPGVSHVLGDLKKVSAKQMKLLAENAGVEIMVAGVPCQGFSLANRKRHDDDDRNQLFRDFLRLAKPVKPRAVVIENVSGMRSAGGGSFVPAIKNAIETELGLDVHVLFLNAAHFGVPQTRERLFFVGLPKGSPWIEPKPTHGPSTGKAFRTVKDAIFDLPPLLSGETSDKYLKRPSSDLAKLLRGEQSILTNHTAPNHPAATISRIARTPQGQPLYDSFRQRIRLAWDAPSPTQVSGGIRAQFQFGHPDQARGLTIRERARIQTFPDSIHVRGGLVQSRVQTGNAVPPLLAQALAEEILRSLRGRKG
jgi:DNA (cytosine-5)-methyltransferase 1